MGWRSRAALIGLAILLQIGTAGWGDLYNETDGQYSGAAKAMAQGGSWIVPENNGEPRLQKPPLKYWMMAISFQALGLNEFAARLPNALGVVAWVLATAAIGQKIAGSRGWLAGIVLLTFLGTFTLARIVQPEPWFSAFVAWALYFALRAGDRRGAAIAFWVLCGLACLIKGWHGLLYPLAVVGAAAALQMIANRESTSSAARVLKQVAFCWPGMLLLFAINAPWYLAMEQRFPGYFLHMAIGEHWGHIAGKDPVGLGYTNVPQWQFVLLHIFWFFPWSLAAVPALGIALRRLWTSWRSFSFPEALVFSWAAVIFGSLLLLGQRQDYYAMSMWPAAAIAFAMVWPHIPRWWLGLLAVGWLALLAGSLTVDPSEFSARGSLAERSTAWATLAQIRGLGPQLLLALRLELLALLAGFAGAAWLCKSQPLKSFLTFAASGAVTCLLAAWGMAAFSTLFSQATLVRNFQGAYLAFDGPLDTGSSLIFYYPNKIDFLATDADRDRFAHLWKSRPDAALVTDLASRDAWQKRLGRFEIVSEAGTQILAVPPRNRPTGSQQLP